MSERMATVIGNDVTQASDRRHDHGHCIRFVHTPITNMMINRAAIDVPRMAIQWPTAPKAKRVAKLLAK